jgi:predicted ATPase/class 3 adenylate cyclase
VTELPSGTVTFVFTDVVGSTRLWEEHPDEMHDALARHDELVRGAIEALGGHVVKTTGDGFHAAFAIASDAIEAAVAAQLALAAEPWSDPGPLRVRMGVHTGAGEVRDGDYYGTALNRAARLMSVAHGGQIVCSESTAGLARETLPADTAFVDLGVHRLRDLDVPERLFQVSHPRLDGAFPPLASADVHPTNLPRQPTSFVGRERELVAIREAMGSARLVTLTGVGGVGKTRLATHVGAEVLSDFADGVWFCELAAAGDPDAMVQVVASTLSIQARAGVSLDARIQDVLRSRRALLIFDNCEHVLDVACDLADGILGGCPGVQILATSREPLDVAGERVIRVRSLPLPADVDDLAQITSTAAVQLFAERASAVDPDFDVSAANAVSVAQICRRLDGIPLAIELAASRVASLRPAEIAELLDERFRLLTGGRRTAVERHKTLRATVDWSYSLLVPTERLVFDRLGVFAGTFDEQAAVAVVGADVDSWVVRDALAGLVHKSIVNSVALDAATSRYQLLETLRAYARDRLEESGEADAVRRRHAGHYAARAELRGAALLTGVGVDTAFRNGLLDTDDTRAAISWALDSPGPGDDELALRIAVVFSGAGPQARRDAGLLTNASRLLERAAHAHPEFEGAILAGLAADALFLEGDLAQAEELAHGALGGVRSASILPAGETPMAYSVLIFCAIARGRFDEARQVVEEAMSHFDAAHGRSFFEYHAARIEVAAGDDAAARRHAEQAVSLARQAEFPLRLAQALSVLGQVTVCADPRTARAALDEISMIEGPTGLLIRQGAYNPLVVTVRLSQAEQAWGTALHALREAAVRARDHGTFTAVTAAALLAGMLADFDRPRTAAVLAGVLTRGPYAPIFPVVTAPDDRQQLADQLAAVRAQLGDDEYEDAISQGAAMSLDGTLDTMLTAIDEMLATAAGLSKT